MDQLILFLKPNKNMRSEKKMDHSNPQTKHTHCDLPCPVNLHRVQRISIHRKLQYGQEEQAASSQSHKPCLLYPSWPVTIHISKCHYVCSMREYILKKVALCMVILLDQEHCNNTMSKYK
jgi:hypothetical protein